MSPVTVRRALCLPLVPPLPPRLGKEDLQSGTSTPTSARLLPHPGPAPGTLRPHTQRTPHREFRLLQGRGAGEGEGGEEPHRPGSYCSRPHTHPVSPTRWKPPPAGAAPGRSSPPAGRAAREPRRRASLPNCSRSLLATGQTRAEDAGTDPIPRGARRGSPPAPAPGSQGLPAPPAHPSRPLPGDLAPGPPCRGCPGPALRSPACPRPAPSPNHLRGAHG